MAGSLRLSGNQFHITEKARRPNPLKVAKSAFFKIYLLLDIRRATELNTDSVVLRVLFFDLPPPPFSNEVLSNLTETAI